MTQEADFTFTTPAAPKKRAKGEDTVLDKLRGELSKKVRRPDIYLEVPERKEMAIRYSPLGGAPPPPPLLGGTGGISSSSSSSSSSSAGGGGGGGGGRPSSSPSSSSSLWS